MLYFFKESKKDLTAYAWKIKGREVLGHIK
jgi:hypothetical protein